MAADWKGGFSEPIEDVPFTFSIDKEGVAKASLQFQVPFDQAISFVEAKVGTYLTLSQFMKFSDGSVSREEGELAICKINYEGISPNNDEQTKYRVRGAGSKEPIETHPDFSTVATAANALFDAEGNFTKFKTTLSGGAVNEHAGTKSFNSPTIQYEEVKVFSNRSAVNLSAKKLQKIDTPPSSEVLPKIASGENWLLNKFDAEPVGDGIRLTRGWLKSGPRGWNEAWYTFDPNS